MKITLDAVLELINRGGPALVVGPGLTTNNNLEAECFAALKAKFNGLTSEPPSRSHFDYADAIISAGACNEVQLRREIANFFCNTALANPQLHGVAKAGWSAVISLACDDFLRARMEDFFYEKPLKWTLTTICMC